MPPMMLQNVTSASLVAHAQTFNLHFVNLSSNLSYLLIYRFDQWVVAPVSCESVSLLLRIDRLYVVSMNLHVDLHRSRDPSFLFH